MRKKAVLPVIAGLIFACSGFAQQHKSMLKDTLFIDEVVITATKTSVARNNVPLTVSVVTAGQIEYSSGSALLPVLSEQVPGLFVTQRGITGFGVASGSAGQISMRGIGGNPNTQVLVLLNGNPQYMGIMGHPLPDAYVASDVEKVEVIHGPASTLYGSNAMGGVINIITREQKEEGFTANVRAMTGSYNTQKYIANGGFKRSGFAVFSSFNHDKTNGHRDSSGFSINNGYIRFGYDPGKKFKLSSDFSLANFNATDPGMEGLKAGNTYDITRGMGAIAFENKSYKTGGSVRFFYNFGEHSLSDGFHSKDKNFGIISYQSFELFKGNTITLGVDFKKYGGIAENEKALNGIGILFGDTTVTEVAGYLFAQQELFKRLTINAGFRLDHHSVFGNEPVPTGGLIYRPVTSTTLKASLSKGFRSPTIRELYLFAPANGSLKPERMMNYETGIIQTFADHRISVELTFFKAKGNNLIQTVMGPKGPQNQNTGEFSNTGVEMSGSFKPVKNFTLHANYSYIAMKEPIIASPQQQLFVSGTFTVKGFTLNASLQNIQNLYTQIEPQTMKESFTLLNSRVTYIINRNVDLFVKGENLTNKKYEINFGYPMPGILFFGGINLHF